MEAAFRIVNMVGSVTVHGWDKDTVLVRAAVPELDRLFMGGTYTGAKLFIDNADERNPKSTRVEVWLPARARLWIKTATATIDGDIHVVGSPAWLRAKSASGAITLRGSSSDAAFSTVSGAVRVDGGNFERTKVETVTGDITFTGMLDRSGTFDFDTHSGSVDIAIPEKVSADLSVVTISGSISNNLSKARPVSARFGHGTELNVEFGNGGAKVSVLTFKGL